VAFEVEVVDVGVDGDELLQACHSPEPQHRAKALRPPSRRNTSSAKSWYD
jgi:hypothetical protein